MLQRRRERATEKGAALILVLWTFAVLSVLAAEFARAMREEAQSVLNFKEQSLGHYTAIAGLNEALLAVVTYNGDIEIIDDDGLGDDDDDSHDNESDDDDDDSEEEGGRRKGKKGKDNAVDEGDESDRLRTIKELIEGRGDWVEGSFNGRVYEVRVFDEGGKIPLNANDLSEEALFAILVNLEYEEGLAREVAAAILDWRDEDDLHRNEGVETDYYEGLDPPYKAKNAPFDAVEELLLVKGVTHDMFYGTDEIPGLVDLFSVLLTRSNINQNSISPEVEQALCGILEGEGDDDSDVLGVGDGEAIQDLESCIEDVGLSAKSTARDGKPNITVARVEARVKNPAGRVVTHIAATVRFKGDGFQTYQWYDAVFDDDEGS